MEKIDLEKLSKDQLIELLMKAQKPTIAAPTPAPRTKKPVPGPVAAPRTKIQQTVTALKGHTVSYQIEIKNNKDPSIQLHDTRSAIKTKLNSQLDEMKGLKYIESIKVSFEKQTGTSSVSKQAYFNSTAQKIINPIETYDSLQLSKQQILNKVAQWISEGSGWTISSVDGHFLNITNYKPLTGLATTQPPEPIENENNKTINGSSYIQLPLQLKNRKGLINLQNKDNECFRWCHIRHLNPQEKDPQRIKQSDRL